ncbi:MAG: hypothetical protein ABIK28_17010 [Planctomycetota bacterium]
MTQQLREVNIYRDCCKDKLVCKARFHKFYFGNYYSNPSLYAVVEYNDGSIDSVDADSIKFITPSKMDDDAGS